MAAQTAKQIRQSEPPTGERLRALPARYYVDEDVLAQERERLFFRSW